MRNLILALAATTLFGGLIPVYHEAETEIEAETIDYKAKYYELLEKYEDLLFKYEALLTGNTEKETEAVEETEDEDIMPWTDLLIGTSVDIDGVTVKYGNLLDVTYGMSNSVIVKTKISYITNNELTIRQNYINVMDLIREYGFDKYDEIQYWAVADMDNGTEGKAISFTVSKETIDLIATNDRLTARGLDEYLDDLWILPSLKQ